MQLQGKNAIVTGSTSGIGESIATMLVAEGCNVMLNGFAKQEDVDALIKKLSTGSAGKIQYSGADVTKAAEVEKMIDDTKAAFGSVDILVNNAGIQFTSPIDKFPDDKWDAVLATNLSASFHAIKHVVPIMRAQKFGRIINTISVHGLVASIEKAAYVAAKHGMVGLTKVTALETARDGITCNGICPGWVLTPLVQKQIDDKAKAEGKTGQQAKEEMLEKQPNREFVNPDEIAALVVFLSGQYASSITGATIAIDGGWTAE